MAERDEGRAVSLLRRVVHRTALAVERRVDHRRRARQAGRVARHLRIVAYVGHGTAAGAVVRGRVVDDPEPPEAVDGESTWAAVRRTIARFATDEQPGVALRIALGAAVVNTVTDTEGYFDVRLRPGPMVVEDGWAIATVGLAAPYRGRTPADTHAALALVRVPASGATVGIISDVDDTILETGAQRLAEMVRTTVRGSALTRTAFPGVAELYSAVAGSDEDTARPVFYVSSSPWNLHGFLLAFLRHRRIPLGPLLLRDLGIDEVTLVQGSHAAHKLDRIREVLTLHPRLRFVLVGDSGQHDAEIYAQVVEEHPGRILAVGLREVRLDPRDGRVETVADRFAAAGVPFVLAPDSVALSERAADLGLLDAASVARVRLAVADEDAGLA